MDHEILVNIMKRSSLLQWGCRTGAIKTGAIKTCKSWLMAALDVFFPSPNIFDLRPHAHALATKSHRKIVILYMTLAIDFRPPTSGTQLLFPKTRLPRKAYRFVAKRLPSLTRINLPAGAKIRVENLRAMVPYWSNLEHVRFPASVADSLGTHCKKIHTLYLFGAIGNYIASTIAENFPLLEHLRIPYCILSNDALSIMLDGHKSLITLDTRHCLCVDEVLIPRIFRNYQHCNPKTAVHRRFFKPRGKEGNHRRYLKANEWNEDEILRKAAGINKFLQCGRKNDCSECSDLY
ncbi:hypothetical protein CCACVL1_12943 [Corchorus capsularis]|uniref:F-box/LRR-repeat protein n=1 Tax=Corchorus capsularis TaxID=210143 RepID=A0A1R3ID32_COCAP|nr:hypothetical protein CCACVL1_12943 [Corchorus capsularis]